MSQHIQAALYLRNLSCLWQLAHCSQTARAYINRAGNAIYLNTAAMHIQNKTAACAALREAHIIAMHRLALTNVTTT